MLTVTVELVPGGDYSRATEIASMEIINTSDLADISDYLVRVQEAGNERLGIPSMKSKVVGVNDHPRRQSVWSLIGKAIEKATKSD